MNSKWPLFIGIALLTIGIVLKIVTTLNPLPLIFILTGVAFKIFYITIKIFTGEYKPGYEVLFLFVGLTFFLGGIILHKQGMVENPAILKITGIALKVLFIIQFIRKSRSSK